MTTTFGLDTLLIRAVAGAEPELPAMATAALSMQLGLSVAYITAVFFPSLTWATPQTPLWLYLLTLIPLAYGSIYSAILRGRERMDLHMVYNLSAMLLQAVGIVVMLPFGLTLWHIALFALLAQIAATLLAYRFVSPVWSSLSLFPVDWVMMR